MACSRAPVAQVELHVQDRALQADLDGGGIGRDRGQAPVGEFGDQVIAQLFHGIGRIPRDQQSGPLRVIVSAHGTGREGIDMSAETDYLSRMLSETSAVRAPHEDGHGRATD